MSATRVGSIQLDCHGAEHAKCGHLVLCPAHAAHSIWPFLTHKFGYFLAGVMVVERMTERQQERERHATRVTKEE